jgi:hypothetical protein
MPASTKPVRTDSRLRRITAERTRTQPVTKRRNPMGFSGSALLGVAAIPVKITQTAPRQLLNGYAHTVLMSKIRHAHAILMSPTTSEILMTGIRKVSFTLERLHWEYVEIPDVWLQ